MVQNLSGFSEGENNPGDQVAIDRETLWVKKRTGRADLAAIRENVLRDKILKRRGGEHDRRKERKR